MMDQIDCELALGRHDRSSASSSSSSPSTPSGAAPRAADARPLPERPAGRSPPRLPGGARRSSSSSGSSRAPPAASWSTRSCSRTLTGRADGVARIGRTPSTRRRPPLRDRRRRRHVDAGRCSRRRHSSSSRSSAAIALLATDSAAGLSEVHPNHVGRDRPRDEHGRATRSRWGSGPARSPSAAARSGWAISMTRR